jgi:hypothetical protein
MRQDVALWLTNEQKRFHSLISDQRPRIWRSPRDETPPDNSKETAMTKNSDLVTQISTAIAGFVLAAYGVAFLINSLNWA